MGDLLTGLMRGAGLWEKPPFKPSSESSQHDQGTAPDEESAVDDGYREEFEDAYLSRLGETIRKQDLPVHHHNNELRDAFGGVIDGDGMLMLEAETGAGKSLYAPLSVREAVKQSERRGPIIMVENRKDAARNAARGMAAITGERLGVDIAYSTSEEKVIDRSALVIVVTSGIFLRWIKEGKVNAEDVGAVIIDEAHDGNQDYHLILGFLKQMRDKGTAPPTLLMSATLPTEALKFHFDLGDQDAFFIEGRQYPVDVSFEAPQSEEGYSYIAHAAEVVQRECQKDEKGDILVFMPGTAEIEDTINRIGNIPGIQVMRLYADLAPQVRDAILLGEKPRGIRRRVIISTNVAETSVTPPGVTLVVDPCRQRSVYFDHQAGTQKFGTEFISKQQAEQRTGRAGRVQPGKAIRLIDPKEFSGLGEYPIPEIRRTNLSQLILRLADMGADPLDFPFIDPPSHEALEHGKKELELLGALDAEGHLTDIGKEMANLPFEPRVSRMLVEVHKTGNVEAALVLAAFTRERKIFNDPQDKFGKNDAKWARSAFSRGKSDWLKNLRIFSEAIRHGLYEYDTLYKKRKKGHGRGLSPAEADVVNEFESWCEQHYLHSHALTHIAYRLMDYARSVRIRIDREALADMLDVASDEALGDAILVAYPDNLLLRAGRRHRRITGDKVNDVTFSFMSDAIEAGGFSVAEKIVKKKEADEFGGERMFIRAWGVHPVTPRQVVKKFPGIMKEELRDSLFGRELEYEYDAESGEVELELTYTLAEDGAWIGEFPYKATVQEFVQLLKRYVERKLRRDPLFDKDRREEDAPNDILNECDAELATALSRIGPHVRDDNTLRDVRELRRRIAEIQIKKGAARPAETRWPAPTGRFLHRDAWPEATGVSSLSEARFATFKDLMSRQEERLGGASVRSSLPERAEPLKEKKKREEKREPKKELKKSDLESELDTVTALISAARAAFSRPVHAGTKREQAVLALLERGRELDREAREIQQVLHAANPNLESLSGRLITLHTAIRSTYTRNLPLIEKDFSGEGLDAYEAALEKMPDSVMSHPDASDFISSDLATLEEIVLRARQEFRQRASPLRGNAKDVQAHVRQAIDAALNSFIR